MKPNRSDVQLSGEEAAKVEAVTRNYFSELEPKRHTKPQRSEESSGYVDAHHSQQLIPEYVEFQHLQKDSQKLVYTGSKVTEEFMETQYYKDLNGVDKHHHTTGTGFIKVENANGKGFSLAPDSDTECHAHASSRGNPATNDWLPAPADTVDSMSGKPNRSD